MMSLEMAEWLAGGGHQLFVQNLMRGREFEKLVALAFLLEGLCVQWHREDPSAEFNFKRSSKAGYFDITVGRSPKNLVPIEVKTSTYPFGPNGEGFRFPEAMVNKVSWFERFPPFATVVVCQETANSFAIPSFTKPQWSVGTSPNRTGPGRYEVYYAPPSCWVSFEILTQWIKSGVRL